MDKEYIQRLKDMLADANAKIAGLDEIQDPQEREAKRPMFLESKKEIEALIKQAGGSTKKPAKKSASKKPAKKSSTKKTTKQVAKKATKKVAKKPAKKSAKKVVKKPVAKKATKAKAPKKAVAKKPAKKSASKKAAKPATKKTTKSVAKKATKKSSTNKDVTVKQFTKAPKKSVKKTKPVKKASTVDDAKEVFSNESKKDLKKAKKSSVSEKKASAKKEKKVAKEVKASNLTEEKINKQDIKSKQEVKADMSVDSNVYMQSESTTENAKVDSNLNDAVSTFESKESKKDEKAILKAAKEKEKQNKKLAKEAAKEYKKQEKKANKEFKKPADVDGYQIPTYTDELARIRNTNNIPEFGSQHQPMSQSDLILNTRYADVFDFEQETKSKEEHISISTYKDGENSKALSEYKDVKQTPAAKVGVEAGPLTNGPVEIPTDEADEVSPNESKPEPVKATEKVEETKSTAKAESVKADSKKAKAAKAVAEESKPVEETKPEAAVEASQEQPVLDKKALKQIKEAEKAKAKAEKAAAKEYKKQEKIANKSYVKPAKIAGFEIPAYTDELARIRNTNNIPEFGSQHQSMSQSDLILNTRYADVFDAEKDKKSRGEHFIVLPYEDNENSKALSEYKDVKQTPTAKVGVEAGPLNNGPVAIPTDEADEVSPNGSEPEPVKTAEKVEETKSAEKAEPVKADSKKAEATKTVVEEPKPVEATSIETETEEKDNTQPDVPTQKELDKQAEKEAKEKAKEEKRQAKLAAKKAKEERKEAEELAKKQQREAEERATEMRRKQEEDKLRLARENADKIAKQQREADEKRKEQEAEINKMADEASAKAAKQAKEDSKKQAEDEKSLAKQNTELAEDEKAEKKEAEEQDNRTAEEREKASKRADIKKGEFIKIDLPPIPDEGVKSLKQIAKRQKQLTSKYSKQILEGAIVTTTDYKPDVSKHVIELHDVVKSYITGDIETPVLKGVNLKLNKGDFIVILGPSGSGKTTFLNTISGLDKATKGDVFVLGYNLSYLKDSHLTKFRRKHVGFIFQQYNLLTNLTAKENAEVGENLSAYKNPDMTIEDIFETIGMKTQMNKYPHQMSGGQQQRVSIARALAKNPDILFADEPTGALDEEMGRKVLEILVEVNKRYGTTVIVVTHNPNIAKIGNTVIHIRNGRVDEVEKNQKPEDPSTIEWA